MAVKYQVFISSTFEDLKEERDQVIRAVLEMGHIPVGMEMFSAADDEQWSIIARQIDEADYYAVVLAHRYGSTTPTGLSYTEKEYDYAVSKGVPVLGFVLDDRAAWPADRMEADERARVRMEQFRAKVRGRMVNHWTNRNDLHAKFSIALMKAFTTHPRIGWTRASDVAGPEVTRELTRLSAENATLRGRVEALTTTQLEQGKEALRDAFRTLQTNKVTAYVRRDGKSWGPTIPSDLLSIFEAIANKLLIENTPEEMAKDIAFVLSAGTDYYPSWPVPKNFVHGWLADLHALDIVEPSTRRHSVSDTAEYWALTSFGRELAKEMRRLQLELSTKPTVDQDPDDAVAEGDAASGTPGPVASGPSASPGT